MSLEVITQDQGVMRVDTEAVVDANPKWLIFGMISMYMTLNLFMQTNTLHHRKNMSAVEEELLIVHINLKHPIHHGVKDRYDITNKFYILKTPINRIYRQM